VPELAYYPVSKGRLVKKLLFESFDTLQAIKQCSWSPDIFGNVFFCESLYTAETHIKSLVISASIKIGTAISPYKSF
jgi:hypothetical protein